MKKFVNEVAYNQVFFFLCALCVNVLVPHVFPIILLYFYMLTLIIQVVAIAIEKRILQHVIFWTQFVIVFIIFIYVMASDWCDFYLYRGRT